MIVRNCYIGGLGDFLMVETSNSHSLKRERVFWLTVCRSFVCSQLTQRRGGMAEGPGGGETAHHTADRKQGGLKGGGGRWTTYPLLSVLLQALQGSA